MLHIFSRGDLDTGKAKFYACDTMDDFSEVPLSVPTGSSALVLSTGDMYQMDEAGSWSLAYNIGSGSGSSDSPESSVVTREEFNSAIEALRAEFGAHKEESTVWSRISN